MAMKGKEGWKQQKTFDLNCSEYEHVYHNRNAVPKPPYLKVDLLPHQIDSLVWMRDRELMHKPGDRENGDFQGGLLCDDCGLGKTVQVLAFLLSMLPYGGGPTLVLCPASMVGVWKAEIEKCVDRETMRRDGEPMYSVYYHKGTKRRNQFLRLPKSTWIVLVSYRTLAEDYNDGGNFLEWSLFNRHIFRRIVADEVHHLRNPNTKIYKAAMEISRRSRAWHSWGSRVIPYGIDARWGLTATPVVNSLMDLYRELDFLGCRAWMNPTDFSNNLMRRMQTQPREGARRLHTILSRFMMRRTSDILELPRLEIHRVDIQLGLTEQEFYHLLFIFSQERVSGLLNIIEADRDPWKSRNIRSSAKQHILTIINHLRMACTSPHLVIGSMKAFLSPIDDLDDNKNTSELFPPTLEQAIERLRLLIQLKDVACPMCSRPCLTRIKPCGHVFCLPCRSNWISKGWTTPGHIMGTCWCRKDIKGTKIRDDHAEVMKLLQPQNKIKTTPTSLYHPMGSKMSWMMNHLMATLNATEDKCVITSQWTRMLDIVEHHLTKQKNGPRWLRIDGSVPPDKRHEIIRKFGTPKGPWKICLISLGSGGEGLNITCANVVYCLDLWWNDAKVYQMQKRFHRIGQDKPVDVYRMVVPNTIEDNIIDMCDKKRVLSGLCLGECPTTAATVTFHDRVLLMFNMITANEIALKTQKRRYPPTLLKQVMKREHVGMLLPNKKRKKEQ